MFIHDSVIDDQFFIIILRLCKLNIRKKTNRKTITSGKYSNSLGLLVVTYDRAWCGVNRLPDR